MTTARMASSSIHRPALLASAALVLAAIIRPAMPAQSAGEDVDGPDDRAGPDAGQPAGLRVDADRLDQHAERGAPGDAARSARRPPSATRIATGRVEHEARRRGRLNGALLTVVIWPSVISIARPRPAVISTRVAMIGWMPSTETRKPFHSPSSDADRRGRSCTPMTAVAGRALVGGPDDVDAGDRAGDRGDRADREVDAAGGDDQRHARARPAASGRRCAGCRSGCRRGGRPASGCQEGRRRDRR